MVPAVQRAYQAEAEGLGGVEERVPAAAEPGQPHPLPAALRLPPDRWPGPERPRAPVTRQASAAFQPGSTSPPPDRAGRARLDRRPEGVQPVSMRVLRTGLQGWDKESWHFHALATDPFLPD